MTTNTDTQIKQKLYCCSFCQKNQKEVKVLIAGPIFRDAGLYICDECVDKCNEIISQTPTSKD